MTTYSYTIELDDAERITLADALAMLKEECDLQIAKKQGAPTTRTCTALRASQTSSPTVDSK